MNKRYIANARQTIELALADQINRRLTGVVSWIGDSEPTSHVDKRIKAHIDRGVVKGDMNGLFIYER
jgi:hypothetical protein